MCHGSCHCGACIVCKIVAGLVALVLTLTTIAAVIGVYMTHVSPAGWVFGSTAGSVALVTFILSLMAWFKVVKKMCPCSSKGCGSGCGCGGGSCDCGDGGKCPGCGKSPCVCK